MATSTATTQAPRPVQGGPAYVYGITWAGSAPPGAEGVGGAEVAPIVHGRVAALASGVPAEGVRARRRDLRRHAEVLRHAFELETVVPMRFGVVFDSGDDVVAQLLAPRHDELVALLHRLDGLCELTVRAFFDEQAVLAEIVERDPTVADLHRAAHGNHNPALQLQLGEAVAHALARRRETHAREILASLVPLAREVEVEERQAELEVLRAAFLIPGDALSAFDAEMNDLARRGHDLVTFKYTGPLPPHHFVNESWVC